MGFIYWLLIGLASTFLAIYLYRNDGTTVTKGELYLASVSPLFGPIVLIMIALDKFYDKSRK